MEQLNRANEDEISLYDLGIVIFKRKKLIIGLFLIAVISATIISLRMPKIYRGDAVFQIPQFEIVSSNISSKDLIDLLGKMDGQRMAKILPKAAVSITNIKLNAFKESKDKIEVIVESKDKNTILVAISELIDYTNTIDLVKLTVKEEQEKLSNRATELSNLLDASKELVNTYSRLLKEGKLLPVGFNPIDLNKKISDIRLEKQMAEQSLQRLNGGVRIIRQADINNDPIKPRIKMTVALSGIISLFSGIFFAFFLEFLEKMKNRYRHSS